MGSSRVPRASITLSASVTSAWRYSRTSTTNFARALAEMPLAKRSRLSRTRLRKPFLSLSYPLRYTPVILIPFGRSPAS